MEYLSRTYPSANELIAPSSLLPARFHHPHLRELQRIPVNWDMIDYCIEYIVAFLATYRWDKERHRLRTSFFVHLACNVLGKSQLDMGTLLVALSFINRASRGFANRLDSNMDKPWDCEELLMAALITANKALNDNCYSLSVWEAWSSVLDKTALRTAERHFLMFIEYDVSVREVELLSHYDGIMEYCVRKPGGWYQLNSVLHPNRPLQEPESPRTFPTPIGAGQPHTNGSQRQAPSPFSVASSSALTYLEHRPEGRHPSRHSQAAYPVASSSAHRLPDSRTYQSPAPSHPGAPLPPLPVPPAPRQPVARASLPPYDRRDRGRSRSPAPRRPRVPPKPAHANSSSEMRSRYGDLASHSNRGEQWDRHVRIDRRVRYPREHILDHNDEPHPRRTSGLSTRTPYDGDRYHRSRRRDSPGLRLPPLRDLWAIWDSGPESLHGYPPPLSSNETRHDYSRSRRAPSPSGRDGWYQR
ncbi:hypothetical protein DAEQUDRAFT_761339 [Daedalea quercina L-15889]|uniref:Cyclin N-terminal domain-containing protein n=1 Tax=Daedalea quercina L-15889 TaxID=1314783 RepID=A0A165U747_9APHY|nr:hypothetical protein DAEQUDRAFT_761339 [Daedalea quercina L-15889]